MFAPYRRALAAVLGLGSLLAVTGCSHEVTRTEPPLALRRGDQAFRYEDYPTAIQAYRTYLDEVEHGDYTARSFYKKALAEYRLGRYTDALDTLDELSQRYPKTHWVQADALRGDAQLAQGHDVEAVKAWETAWRNAAGTDRDKLRERIARLARTMDAVQLAEARRAVNSRDVRKLLDQQIAKRQPTDGDEHMPGSVAVRQAAAETNAPPIIAEPLEDAPNGHHAAPSSVAPAPQSAPIAAVAPTTADDTKSPSERFMAEEAALDTRSANAAPAMPAPGVAEPIKGLAKIGCLLPLTGASSDYGKAALRGLQLIFGEHDEHLIVKDTGSDPQTAAQMFTELMRDPTVLIVIGPLRSDEAEVVAPRAEQAQVPLFLLSQRDGLTHRYALQLGMTRSSQISSLLSYAMDRVRLRRFGVLYPKDAFGSEFLTAFKAEVQHRGGTVVGAESYAPETRNVSANLDAVKKWRRTQNVQAIFLPDNAEAAADFAAVLQRELPDVTLLGVHGWENLAVRKDTAPLNGMLFTDAFYAGSGRPATRDFVERFQHAYGQLPGVLEAQAYDAGLLARRTIGAGANSRAGVLQQLDSLGPFDGATGELRMTPGGLERALFLLQVYDGKVQEITTSAG